LRGGGGHSLARDANLKRNTRIDQKEVTFVYSLIVILKICKEYIFGVDNWSGKKKTLNGTARNPNSISGNRTNGVEILRTEGNIERNRKRCDIAVWDRGETLLKKAGNGVMRRG